MVEYLVLLELPFRPQLEEEYEKVKVALKEELQNVSQDGNSCQNDQGEQRLGAWGGGRGQGHSHHPSLLQLTQGPSGGRCQPCGTSGRIGEERQVHRKPGQG